MEHTGTIISETRFISAKDVDMTSSEQQALPIPDSPLALSTPIKPRCPATTDSSTSPMIKSFSTFSGSLSLPVDYPLSKEEKTLNTHLVRKYCTLTYTKDSIMQDQRTTHSVTKRCCIKKSHIFSKATTKRKQANIVKDVRSTVEETSADAEDTQVILEL